MTFQIYNIYKCPRCEHYKLDVDHRAPSRTWRKMGYCRHFNEDIRRDPARDLTSPGNTCDALDKRRKRGIASLK